MSRRRRNPDDEEEDEIRDSILSAAEDAVEDLANAQAAQAWSTVDDVTADEYDDVFIVAEFGDWLAVNGDLVWAEPGIRACHICGGKGILASKKCWRCEGSGKVDIPRGTGGGWGDIEIPAGFKESNKGGRITTTEEEIQNDFIADWINSRKEELGLGEVPNKVIEEVIKKNLEPYVYTSVSGDATIYVKGKKKR